MSGREIKLSVPFQCALIKKASERDSSSETLGVDEFGAIDKKHQAPTGCVASEIVKTRHTGKVAQSHSTLEREQSDFPAFLTSAERFPSNLLFE